MKLKTMITSTVLASGLLFVLVVSCVGPTVGLVDGSLRDCPSSPNCVCSEVAFEDSGYIEPFAVPAGEAGQVAFDRLAGLVEERATIETLEPGYLHAVFKTSLLRFRDDFEARLEAEGRQIHVRSASRLGFSDLGANRRRVEALREAYEAARP